MGFLSTVLVVIGVYVVVTAYHSLYFSETKIKLNIKQNAAKTLLIYYNITKKKTVKQVQLDIFLQTFSNPVA